MIDYKDLLSKFSFENESVWLVVFSLLPLVLGILVYLVLLLLNAFKVINF